MKEQYREIFKESIRASIINDRSMIFIEDTFNDYRIILSINALKDIIDAYNNVECVSNKCYERKTFYKKDFVSVDYFCCDKTKEQKIYIENGYYNDFFVITIDYLQSIIKKLEELQ